MKLGDFLLVCCSSVKLILPTRNAEIFINRERMITNNFYNLTNVYENILDWNVACIDSYTNTIETIIRLTILES